MSESEGMSLNTIKINGKQYAHLESGSQFVDQTCYTQAYPPYNIDFSESPTLQSLAAEFLLQAHGKTENDAIAILRKLVNKQYPIRDISQVDTYAQRQIKPGSRVSVSLEDFARAGVGYCAQAAQTTLLLIEKAREQGVPLGDAYFRNEFWESATTAGGHAWIDYDAIDGRQLVIDLVQSYDDQRYDPLGYYGDRAQYHELLRKIKERVLNNYA